MFSGSNAWWYFRIYSAALDESGKRYLWNYHELWATKTQRADLLIQLKAAVEKAQTIVTAQVLGQLSEDERDRFKQLIHKDFKIGPDFLKLLRFRALFHKCHNLGQLSHVLPLQLHEEVILYLRQVFSIWSTICESVGQLDIVTVRALEGLYPKYCISHQVRVKRWVEANIRDIDTRQELTTYLLGLQKIVSVGTFFQDVKLLEFAQSNLRRILNMQGLKKGNPRQYFIERFRADGDFYIAWCELLLCCVRHMRSTSDISRPDAKVIECIMHHARRLGFDVIVTSNYRDATDTPTVLLQHTPSTDCLADSAQSSGTEQSRVPNGLTHIFLIVNVIAMTTSSTLIILRKYSEYAVVGLFGVVVTQALGYGLIFDLNFFLRNLSVLGGLLMVLSDSWVRKTFAPAGLPQIDEKDRKMYFQLAGRVLLIFLFIGFVFAGDWSIGRLIVIAIGAVACVMVVVGFKAKWSAIMLVLILSIFNVLVNNFWMACDITLHHNHPQKDFAKYDFFQILSIVGGLLLLVNMGPGQFSMDEKKEVY
ncbi:SURF4-like protein 1 [Elsinoe fawcettii]|nr:SURF4-like protein 1 [Elsinoe fawcettii]